MEIVAGVLVIAVAVGFGGLLVTLLVRHGASPEGFSERWRRIPRRTRVLFIVSIAVYVAVGVLLAEVAGS